MIFFVFTKNKNLFTTLSAIYATKELFLLQIKNPLELHILLKKQNPDTIIIDTSLLDILCQTIQMHCKKFGKALLFFKIKETDLRTQQSIECLQKKISFNFKIQNSHPSTKKIQKKIQAGLTNYKKSKEKIYKLHPKEEKILEFLKVNSSRFVSIEEIELHLWNEISIKNTNTVYCYISHIRKYLRENITIFLELNHSCGNYMITSTKKTSANS